MTGGPKASFAFPKRVRLTLTSEFSKVRTRGVSVGGRNLVLGVLHVGESGQTRVGIITSRRVGGAVARNRVRRRIREIVRKSLPGVAGGYWIVIIARKAAVDATFAVLDGEWRKLADRAGILAAS